MTPQSIIDLAKQVAIARGAICLEGGRREYQDIHVFVAVEGEQVWFSIWDGEAWEVIVDVDEAGQVNTLAVYVEAEEFEWLEYLRQLSTVEATDRSDPTEKLSVIADVSPSEVRQAIATLNELIGLGVSTLKPLLSIVRYAATS